MDPLIDHFLEVYFGKYGRPDAFQAGSIDLKHLDDRDALFYLNEITDDLSNELPLLVKTTDSDLLNIRDEMLGLFNNTKYLFYLK
jgi:hypothetical protein